MKPFRRPIPPVIPGRPCPSTWTSNIKDVIVYSTSPSLELGRKPRCPRCGAKNVEVTKSINVKTRHESGWHYSGHLAPTIGRNRKEQGQTCT